MFSNRRSSSVVFWKSSPIVEMLAFRRQFAGRTLNSRISTFCLRRSFRWFAIRCELGLGQSTSTRRPTSEDCRISPNRSAFPPISNRDLPLRSCNDSRPSDLNSSESHWRSSAQIVSSEPQVQTTIRLHSNFEVILTNTHVCQSPTQTQADRVTGGLVVCRSCSFG